MTFEEYFNLREAAIIPDDLPALLQALLLDAAGDWDSAHRIAQQDLSREGSRVHAYLHREEGDLSNAAYWYSQAGLKMPDMSLEDEWETIARVLLGPKL